MKKTLCSIFAVILTASMLFALSSCGGDAGATDENVTETVAYTESLTPEPQSSEEVLAYFNTLVNGVKEKTPAVNYKQELKVDNSSISITKVGEEDTSSLKSFNDAAKGIKDLILTDIKSKSGSLNYGEENDDIFFVKGENWASTLTADDIDDAYIKEVGDNYLITIEFAEIPEESKDTLAKAFELRDKDTILNSSEFAKTASYLTFNGFTMTYSGCTISATVNRFTNEISNVTYGKVVDVDASVTGLETLAEYGDMDLKFILKDTTSFNFSWTESRETSPLETADNA